MALEIRKATPRQDRVFFSLVAVWFVALTFIGFSPTFFLRNLPVPLPTNQVVHGVVYSAWILLFLVQALLISARRVRLHIVFGTASTILLALMIPVGFNVVLVKVTRGLKSVDEAGLNLTMITLGFSFALAAFASRKRPVVHKRLMLFATLMFTVAAADRVAIILGLEDVRLFRKTLALAPGLALVGFDIFTQRRFPVLSVSFVVLALLVIWLNLSDLIFLDPMGDAIIMRLARIFVW